MDKIRKPKIIEHLISIGFKEIIGSWEPVWGQGDGIYWHGHLVKNSNVVFTGRDETIYKYSWNGVIKPEEFFMSLTKEDTDNLLLCNTWISVKDFPLYKTVKVRTNVNFIIPEAITYNPFMIAVKTNKGWDYAYVQVNDDNGTLEYAYMGESYTSWSLTDVSYFMVLDTPG